MFIRGAADFYELFCPTSMMATMRIVRYLASTYWAITTIIIRVRVPRILAVQ